MRSCGVAIVAEVKATESAASLTAAKNQWYSLAYLHIMERVSITKLLRKVRVPASSTFNQYIKTSWNVDKDR